MSPAGRTLRLRPACTSGQLPVYRSLRRARQRQQERREMEKAVEAEIYRPGTVEKDW